MPPHPRLETLTTCWSACFTPGVSIDAGTGRAPGSAGSSPANTGGDCTPARTCSTLARPGGSRPEQDSDQQAHVLGEREPDPAPVSVRESDDRRDQDQDVDEVDQPALPRNTLPACSGRTLSLGDRVDPCFFSSANGCPRGWG